MGWAMPASDSGGLYMKNILFVASEGVPFIKTGGLADVVGSLPKCLDKQYYDVRVILPKYTCMKQEMKDKLTYKTHFYMDFHWKEEYVGILEAEVDGVKYYFIDNEGYFNGFKPYSDNALFEIEKYAFFCKAALSILPVIDFRPDLIHCHDWQTGLIPVYLKERFQGGEFYRGIKTVMTIHNLKFQGKWSVQDVKEITGGVQRRQPAQGLSGICGCDHNGEQHLRGGDQDSFLRGRSGRTSQSESGGSTRYRERNRL